MEDRTDITAEGFYVSYLRTFNPVLIPLTLSLIHIFPDPLAAILTDDRVGLKAAWT